MLVADVAADRESQPAGRSRAVVANDIAGEIRRHDHVVPFGITNLPLAERVDISVIEFELGKFALTDFAKHFAEEPMRADDV